jgi:hypothetical protein
MTIESGKAEAAKVRPETIAATLAELRSGAENPRPRS